jgi:hypothetical protein
MDKMLTMDCDEAIDYIRKNVKIYDNLELSYHRVFTPGEVINIQEYDCEEDRKSCRVIVQIEGENLGQSVEVDMEEIKDDLIEIKHIPAGEEYPTTIVIEKCEQDIE